ncbi:hypothetical protein SESBI_08351 [Sesbania bispinosa]|nr:hypothetical protein SESBI_08351 [Sesbania bispinosa]
MSRDYVFGIEELSDPEVAVVKALQAFREEHGILGCHRILNGGGRSLKDRLGDMAGNNMLALAEKRAKREAAKRAASDAERAVATGAGSSALTSSQAATQVPGERPLKKVRTEALKGPLNSGKGGHLVFAGCHDGGVFHSTIDEVAALPQIKKDFEAVSKKLKDDEVVMQDALKKVKGLSDDNIRLTDKNKELEEEIKKLKSDLDTKRSKPSKPSWKNKRWRKISRRLGRSGSEVEIAPPPMHPLILEADITTGDMKGPSESEMVDAQILGLEDNKSDGDVTALSSVQE